MFLVGRCGCRLKNESPGWDILLNLDWEKALAAAAAGEAKPAGAETSSSPLPPIKAVFTPLPMPEVVTINADMPVAGHKGTLIAGVAAGLALLVLIPRWLKK